MCTHLRKIDEAASYGTASFFINFNLLGRTLRPIFLTKEVIIVTHRTRNVQLKINLTEEKALFQMKMKMANCKTMNHFLRKVVSESNIYVVDLQPFREIQGLLSRYADSVNQIAKRVNSTGVIYSDDINDMKQQIEHLSKEIWQIHSLLLDRTTTKGDDS